MYKLKCLHAYIKRVDSKSGVFGAGNLNVDALGKILNAREVFENDLPAIMAMDSVRETSPGYCMTGSR